MSKIYNVHSTCFIDEDVTIEQGVKIWHFGHILKNVTIKERTTIGQNACIGPNVTIGANCRIQNNVSIPEGVIIEDNVFIGPNVTFTNIKRPRAFINQRTRFQKTIIRSQASIGANATLLCGVEIKERAFVAAGALITSDVPQNVVAAGSPATLRHYICECGHSLYCKKRGAPIEYDPGLVLMTTRYANARGRFFMHSLSNLRCPACGATYHLFTIYP